jgi:hypothetical protein
MELNEHGYVEGQICCAAYVSKWQSVRQLGRTRMALTVFHINVKNDGPEAAVIVTEFLNDNETIEVLNRQMSHGEIAENVECQGTGYKTFKWENIGSGNSGTAEKADGLTLLVDPQG